MTTKDKTGDQLVASIRKSKTGAVSQKNTRRRTAAKKKSTRRPRSAPKTGGKVITPGNMDGYSTGRRVWPD